MEARKATEDLAKDMKKELDEATLMRARLEKKIEMQGRQLDLHQTSENEVT